MREGEPMSGAEKVDVADLIESQKFGGFQLSVLGWSLLLMLVEGYDMQVLSYAAPAIIKAWQIERAAITPVLSASLFGYLIGATCLTGLADRFGRKGVILAGLMTFGLFTWLAAFATSLNELIVLRAIAGLGLGSSIPTVIALNAEYAASRHRAMRISLLFVGYTIGSALGGFIAAKLMPVWGWPVVFQIGGIIPLLLCGFLIFMLPESIRFLALAQKHPSKLASIVARLRPDLNFARGTVFFLREENHGGLPVTHLFTDGRALMTLLLWIAFVTSFLGHHFITGWLPTMLERSGLSLANAVQAGALFQVGGAVGSLVVGWLLDKRGPIVAAMAFALAVPFVILIGTAGMSVYMMLSVVSIAGIFVLGGQVGLNALSGTLYPTYVRSTGAGWAFGVGRFGSVLGPVVGGLLLALKLPTSTIFLCASVLLLCCAFAVFLLGQRTFVRAGEAKLA